MPAAYLADTNILSQLARPRPNRGVVDWAAGVRLVALSVITVEEIAFGLAWKPSPRVKDWLRAFLEEQCEILPVTIEIAERGGELRGQLRAEGRTHTQADMLIAATADFHGLTLVTRNARDFQGCRISVLDPFS